MTHEPETDTEIADLLEEVRRIEAQSNRLVSGVMAGGYSSVFKGSGIEFDEIREYVDGDDPRAVDWNVTARVGRPFVKEYIEERERTLLFLLDLSRSMSTGFGIWSMRQMAARVCACLSLSAIQNDDKVGLIAFSRGIDKFVPARKGIRHALRIVRDCLVLEGESAETELAPALEFASRALRRRTILFLVSDFHSTDWRKAATLCAQRHDLIAVRLLPPELEAPTSGLMRCRDPETGHETVVDWGSRRVREAYLQRVADWRKRTAEDLRRARIDLMDVPVPTTADKDAVARPILAFFRMREHRASHR